MMNYKARKFDMKNLPQLAPPLLALLLLCAVPGHSSYQNEGRGQTFDKIASTIRSQFGSKLKVINDTSPYYLQGDFNGDGVGDIAVLVNSEDGREELKDHNVKYIDIDPWRGSNGQEKDPVSDIWNNCLGIAVIHGTAAGWDAPAAKYIFYQCFTPFRIVRKGQKIRKGRASTGPTPVPKGDSIQLDLENGATMLVYWNGKTYRGFGQRIGD
jgi:hypothetical protein